VKMISCIFCYRRYCMMWRHLAPPPLWVSWDIVRLLTIETQKSQCLVEHLSQTLINTDSCVCRNVDILVYFIFINFKQWCNGHLSNCIEQNSNK
jgi:hypothetical protein